MAVCHTGGRVVTSDAATGGGSAAVTANAGAALGGVISVAASVRSGDRRLRDG
jgi:hypothetical protein